MTTTMSDPGDAQDRLWQIDVLRGLAALAVFVFHVAGAAGFPKRTLPPIALWGETWAHIPSPLSFGATGVSLFFVISGFCLTLKPLDRGRLYIRQYARDRVARVYPAYFAAVLFSWLVADLRGIRWSPAEVAAYLLFLHGFIQAWYFSLNGALWSMSTEVQFYVCFPLVLASIRRLQAGAWLFAIALLVFAWRFHVASTETNEVIGGITKSAFRMNSLAGRMLEFALGVGLARLWLTDRASIFRLSRRLLLPALLVGLLVRMHGPPWMADPVMGVMYVVLLGYAITHFGRFANGGLLASFGRASYSFFLLHLPVVSLIADALPPAADRSPYTHFFALLTLSFASTIPLSTALYRYVELPCWRRLKSARQGQLAAPANRAR